MKWELIFGEYLLKNQFFHAKEHFHLDELVYVDYLDHMELFISMSNVMPLLKSFLGTDTHI